LKNKVQASNVLQKLDKMLQSLSRWSTGINKILEIWIYSQKFKITLGYLIITNGRFYTVIEKAFLEQINGMFH